MWVYNDDTKRWEPGTGGYAMSSFSFLKQELSSTRFYSKFLSGATYIPVNSVSDIYEILGKWQPRSWYHSTAGSKFSETLAPPRFATAVDLESSYDYTTRFLSEYGLTLKNLFTPERLINDSMKNVTEVDVATTEPIDLERDYEILRIDGQTMFKGQLLLVKDQFVTSTIDSTIDPQTYFTSNYYFMTSYGSFNEYRYFDEENGIYLFDGRRLVRQDTFDDYSRCLRASVYIRTGDTNKGRQFHLSRLLNGYYPTTSLSEPMEFAEKKNWLVRHRVDYNNLFEINYYDVVKHDATQYAVNGFTYSIPKRTLSVGEFGVINVHQNGMTTIVPNKYKVNLRSVSMTSANYWICGDEATLLKVRKHDFHIEKVKISGYDVLRSVSFYDDQRGAVVGDLNMILLTFDGGANWKRLRIDDFAPYNYNKVLFSEYGRLFVIGRGGVFIEIEETPSGWMAYKRRISKFIDDDDENILVDNINDMIRVTVPDWGITYEHRPENVVGPFDLLLMVTDGNNLVAYDLGNAFVFDFIYLDFPTDQGDIINISRAGSTNNFYFTNNSGLHRFDITKFEKIGVVNQYSNNSIATESPTLVNSKYANETFDYNGLSMLVAGNNSLLQVATYSSGVLTKSTEFYVEDPDFESRLRAKLLFLDYDMASKLNFFTDQGDYRLPSSVSFDTMIGASSSMFSISTNSNQGSSVGSKSRSWGFVIPFEPTKTRGGIKEIRLNVSIGTNPNSSLPNPSLTSLFIRHRKNFQQSWKTMSVLKNGQLKPGQPLINITFSTNPRYPSIMEDDVPVPGKIYRMDMSPGPYTVGDFQVNSNSVKTIARPFGNLYDVDGDWSLSLYDPVQSVNTFAGIKLEFFYENSSLFLAPRIIPSSAPSYVQKTEHNWWTYRSDSLATFPYYSNVIPGDSTKVLISSSFSSYASYSVTCPYMLTVVPSNVSTLKTDLEVIFPSISATESEKIYSGKALSINTLELKDYGLSPVLYLWSSMAALEVDKDWVVSVGDVIRIESPIADVNAVVNRIATATRKISNVDYVRKFVYMHTGFNDNIVNDLVSVGVTVRNLNRYVYVNELVENFSRHPIGTAYSMTQSGDFITIDAKFNPDTAYFNLASVVNFDGVVATMSYQDSFMKFGYSPNYNILDYLERVNKNVNNPTFYFEKEYYSLPNYKGFKMLNPWTASSIYIDSSGMTSSKYRDSNDPFNKLVFGEGLRLEWESIMLNTFVDLTIYQPNAVPSPMTYSVSRLLVMKKYEVENYENSGMLGLIIEFQKRIDFQIFPGANLNDATINISSRRKLGQISDDLQELNNIHQRKSRIREGGSSGWTFSTFERELNSKFPTDSYAKVLLSDVDTVESLSALFYIDHKNELAMNVTKLDRAYEIPILNTSDFNGLLMISCGQKHGLEVGDGVVIDFSGGTASSQEYNTQYFGYHTVKQLVSEYDVVLNLNFGNTIYIGNDIGTLRYLRKDPFLNYQPVDIIEVGSDRTTNISIKIEPENVVLSGPTFSLENLDYNRYRFKLVDGLSLTRLNSLYPWILEAEISDAVLGEGDDGLVWYKGVWESGRWFGGQWWSGEWLYGDWYGGSWSSAKVVESGLNYIVDEKHSEGNESTWHNGRWFEGSWSDGVWVTGRWYEGTWNNGSWYNGIWNDGIWKLGRFIGGIWVLGTWEDGFFSCDNEPAFWVDGEWMSGDFENGIWYNGIFGSRTSARFGVNSSNSRPAIWNGGLWKSGSFHSGKPQDIPTVSEVHKYSVWKTGQWLEGNFYGGVAYNMSLNTGTWHGGILDEIQVIGMNAANNSFTLNGVFRFNLGDTFYILDNNVSNEYSRFGSNTAPVRYTVVKSVVDTEEEITEVYVATDINVQGLPSYIRYSGVLNSLIPTGLGSVSSFVVGPFENVLKKNMKVNYETNNVKYIRLRINLMSKRISDLGISLQSPGGQVMNVILPGVGSQSANVVSTNNSMVNTIFTTERIPVPTFESPQTGLYPATMLVGVGGTGLPLSSVDDIAALMNYDGTVTGTWSLYIRDFKKTISLNKFSSGVKYNEIGGQLRITNLSTTDYDSIRIGDMVTILSPFLTQHVTGTELQTYVTDKVTGGVGGALVLAATASVENSNFFDKLTANAAITNPASALYGQFAIKSNLYWDIIIGGRTSFYPNIDSFNRLIDWELQFLNDVEVGAVMGRPKSNGIETGLRVVSDFRNVEWKSGIWTNGMFESGNFRSGMFINGIFKGKFGV